MTKVVFLLTLLLTVLVCGLPAAPAQAQATRAFVSATGSDTNSCINIASPCRHFQAAYNAMPNGGEIDVLDPANYGALTANHTLSIVGRGWATLSPVSGSAAIVITAGPTDTINISGVALDGANIALTSGIIFVSGGSLSVQDSVMRNFTHDGIDFFPSAASQLFVSNTLLSNNTNGIVVEPSGSGSAAAALDHVATVSNSINGIQVASFTGQANKATVSDSVSVNNANGIDIDSSSGGTAIVTVRNSAISNNTANGLLANTTGAVFRVTRSTITGNGSGVSAVSGGLISTYADNDIDDNTGGNTPPPTLTYK